MGMSKSNSSTNRNLYDTHLLLLQRLEHELDFIKGQQSELEDLLRPLEASLTTAPRPDPERERTYQLAETLDAQLQRMSDDLREVIEHLNTANR